MRYGRVLLSLGALNSRLSADDIYTVLKLVGEVRQGDVSVAEIHGGSYAEREIIAQAELAQHAHGESRIPSVLVAGDDFFGRCPVGACNNLRTDVHKLDVLKVHAYHHSEVKRPQVGVRSVLNGLALCHGA